MHPDGSGFTVRGYLLYCDGYPLGTVPEYVSHEHFALSGEDATCNETEEIAPVPPQNSSGALALADDASELFPLDVFQGAAVTVTVRPLVNTPPKG